MKDDWIKHCLRLSRMEADFYSGCRKIIRGTSLVFKWADPWITLEDAGYTKYKMTLLLKLYKNEESIAGAKLLWDRRKTQNKYGSVGFHCYNHLMKGQKNEYDSYWNKINDRKAGVEKQQMESKTIEGKSSRASVMGPCIQAVNITLLNKKKVEIDVFYRTTELFKKFPADLVMLKEHLLSEFDFTGLEVTLVRCHFANITCHPMYFVTLLPSLSDPIAELEKIKAADKHFFDWIVKWTARYVIEEYHRGIAKFAQAQRVKKDALKRLDPTYLKRFQKYLKDNHPGHRNEYMEDEDDAED